MPLQDGLGAYFWWPLSVVDVFVTLCWIFFDVGVYFLTFFLFSMIENPSFSWTVSRFLSISYFYHVLCVAFVFASWARFGAVLGNS